MLSEVLLTMLPETLDVELGVAWFLVAVLSSLGILYGIRVLRSGRATFERVDRQGGSQLLSKDLMEMGYWAIQPVARKLIGARVSADSLSFCSLGLGFVAGGLLAAGRFGSAALLGAVSGALDALDGLVARETGTASKAGAVLDSAVDRYVEFFSFAGIMLYYREHLWIQMLALAGILGSFMVSYSTAKAEEHGIKPPRGSMRRSERAVYLSLGAALSPLSIAYLEGTYLPLLVSALAPFFGLFPASVNPMPAGLPMIMALGIIAVAANYSAVIRLRAISRAARTESEKICHARSN